MIKLKTISKLLLVIYFLCIQHLEANTTNIKLELQYELNQENIIFDYDPYEATGNDIFGLETEFDAASMRHFFSFLGVNQWTSFSFSHILANMSKNICMHFGTFNKKNNAEIEASVRNLHEKLQVPYNYYLFSEKPLPKHLHYQVRQVRDEDLAVNPYHLLLIILAIALCFIIKENRHQRILIVYISCIFVGFALLCIWFGWSPYNSRRQLPLFLLAAPFIAMVLGNCCKKIFLLEIFSVLLLIMSWNWLFYNDMRPLKGNDNILSKPREEQYFKKISRLYLPFKTVAEFIKAEKIDKVGLYFGRNTSEYPLLRLIKDGSPKTKIEHIGVKHRLNLAGKTNDFLPGLIVSIPYGDISFQKGDQIWTKIWEFNGVNMFLREDLIKQSVLSTNYTATLQLTNYWQALAADQLDQYQSLYDQSMRDKAWAIFNDLDDQMLENGRFLGGQADWQAWQNATKHLNKIKINNGVLRIENPYKKLIGLQQRVNVVSGEVFRLSGLARSVDTTDSSIIFGGRIIFWLPPQKEKALVWMTEYDGWSEKELIFTNTVTGSARIAVDMGYGMVGSTGEFTNIRLERVGKKNDEN